MNSIEAKTDSAPELGLVPGSAVFEPTPGPWTWEHHPMRKGVMALSAGQTDVILAAGDDECAWAEISDSNRKLIAAAPEMLAAIEGLMQIVEGVRNERWTADGRRLKDTPEWCRLYSLRCAILRPLQNVKGEPTAPQTQPKEEGL